MIFLFVKKIKNDLFDTYRNSYGYSFPSNYDTNIQIHIDESGNHYINLTKKNNNNRYYMMYI